MDFTHHREIQIPVTETLLEGELVVPDHAEAIVIFAHGSGSSRNSKRNQMVAQKLQQHNIGTLLLDLLTEEEDKDYGNRFNIELLSKRLVDVTKWLSEQKDTRHCQIGYFGASTGAASALKSCRQDTPDRGGCIPRWQTRSCYGCFAESAHAGSVACR
jgi:putative phosphoribosyl transferase